MRKQEKCMHHVRIRIFLCCRQNGNSERENPENITSIRQHWGLIYIISVNLKALTSDKPV